MSRDREPLLNQKMGHLSLAPFVHSIGNQVMQNDRAEDETKLYSFRAQFSIPEKYELNRENVPSKIIQDAPLGAALNLND